VRGSLESDEGRTEHRGAGPDGFARCCDVDRIPRLKRWFYLAMAAE
jgi:hypothetical protein